MTQVSKYPLDKVVEKEMFVKFWGSVSSLKNAQMVSVLFSDFLTETENMMFAKRFTIAVLLLRGKSQRDITNMLHVSYSGTGAVAAWLKNAKPETLKILNQVIIESKWDEFVDKIEAFMDSLPSSYRKNWRRVGKEKWARMLARESKRSLR